MDYETPDGSQFSLREAWTLQHGEPVFGYTTVSAHVDGIAYTGKLKDRPQDIDDADVLNSLELVPPECIHPKFPDGFTLAPEIETNSHYLKSPQFAYEDCQPGTTFVAERFLNEASVLERLKAYPHPNIVTYHGCVVKRRRITHLCLERYPWTLAEFSNRDLTESQIEMILDSLKSAIRHLHSLGIAHNDVNEENVVVDGQRNAILIDFDSCHPFGEPLQKGVAYGSDGSSITVSGEANDYLGLDNVANFLRHKHGRTAGNHNTARESPGPQREA